MKNKKIGLRYYLKKYKWPISSYIILSTISSLMIVFSTILFAEGISKITLNDFNGAITICLIALGIEVIKRICWYIESFIYTKYSNELVTDMNLDLANQAFKLNSQTYTNHDTGTFVQRIVYDPQNITVNLISIVDKISGIVTSLIITIYITCLNIYIGIILLAIIIICFFIEYFRRKIYKKNRKEVRRLSENINSLTTEIVKSEKDIKALGLEEKLNEASKIRYNAYKKASFKQSFTDNNLGYLKTSIIGISTIAILILGINLMSKGLLTLATYMIIYSNSNNLYSLIFNLGSISNNFLEIKIASERMFKLFDNDEFVCEKFGQVKKEIKKGSIEFKNVHYAYQDIEYIENYKEKSLKKAKSKQSKEKIISKSVVFDNLSFKIKPNTTVAFVGKSGSGKSTILSLMSKMYEVDSGEVLIDNVNINDLDKESLRNSISLVNQFPYIFDMTIKENLLLAKKDATDEEIYDAIKKSALDEFISGLKKGIDSKVGESGIKLSGGQKQRLAIARALLRKSPIILFDESTSSLDNFAQEHIKKSIENLSGKKTIVIVAHRLSTIKSADKIYFLDEGKIVDSGTFNKLYNNNKKFREMFLVENV